MPVRKGFILSVVSLISSLHAQTNTRAWHTAGQTFVVWEHSGPVPRDTTYDIYRDDQPISSLSSATWVGRVFACDGENYRIWPYVPGARWRVPDGLGGYYTIGPNEDLFVYTPHEPGSFYYAVVLTGDTLVGPSNTAGPINETADPITCHIQVHKPDTVTIYAHWIDGRSDYNSGRPDYPVMGNEWANSVGFNFAVWEPFGGLPPGDVPLVTHIHGGYGNLLELAAVARFLVPGGLLLCLDDPLRCHVGFTDTMLDINTYWFGYRKKYNRFAPAWPVGQDTVVNYTARRVWWEIEWVKENLAVDPDRVSLHGWSMGGFGTAFHTQMRPDLFSAGLAEVPQLKGPKGNVNPTGLWAIFGDTIQNYPTNFPGNPRFYDLTDQAWRVRQPHEDWPFLICISGKHDTLVLWPHNHERYILLDSARTGAWLYWDERGHMSWEWVGAHFNPSEHISASFLTRFRRNQSFPAFWGTDLWPDSSGRQPDIGSGDTADGDPWGTWGGYLEWDPASVIEQPDKWSVKIWVVHQSAYPNDIPESDTILTNLTPRRLRSFRPVPGGYYRWCLVRDSDGDTLQAGVVQAGSDSTIDVMGLLLLKEKTTLTIEPTADISEYLPQTLTLTGNSPNPFSGKTTVSFALYEPGPVSIMFYNALGQRVLELPLGKLGPGFHRVAIEPGLKPGVYFYRLAAGQRLSGIKIMVIQ